MIVGLSGIATRGPGRLYSGAFVARSVSTDSNVCVSQVTDETLRHLADNCPDLQSLVRSPLSADFGAEENEFHF